MRFLFFAVTLATVVSGCAELVVAREDVLAEARNDPASRGVATPDRAMLRSLEGSWTGYLEYRDFNTDQIVRLPAKARMDAADNDLVLSRSLVFTDPTYDVETSDVVMIEGDGLTEVSVEADGPVTTSYRIVERTYRTSRDWELVLEREGTDNGQPAGIRLTQVMLGRTFTSTRDVLTEGATEYLFRNRIRVERD